MRITRQRNPRRKKVDTPLPQMNLAACAWTHVKIHMGERGALRESRVCCRGIRRGVACITTQLRVRFWR